MTDTPCTLDHPLRTYFEITSTGDPELDAIQIVLAVRRYTDDDDTLLRVLDFISDRIERERADAR